jgi:hypothetical protein
VPARGHRRLPRGGRAVAARVRDPHRPPLTLAQAGPR